MRAHVCIWTYVHVCIWKKKWKCVNFKCYSSEELITLNTLHEVVPTWYSFHSWVDWSNADKVSCSRRKHIDAGIEPATFESKVDILSPTPMVHIYTPYMDICTPIHNDIKAIQTNTFIEYINLRWHMQICRYREYYNVWLSKLYKAQHT